MLTRKQKVMKGVFYLFYGLATLILSAIFVVVCGVMLLVPESSGLQRKICDPMYNTYVLALQKLEEATYNYPSKNT